MFLIEFILLAGYIFLLAGAFFQKDEAEPEKTPEKELEDAVLNYILHINKNASDKTE